MSLTEDPEANHAWFLQQVRESGQVWGLKSSTGWAVSESGEFEDTLVYPFWANPTDAAPHCTGDWAHFQPTAVPLEAFLNDWLPGMSEDAVLVGTNWDAELSGMEWEPLELASQLRQTQA